MASQGTAEFLTINSKPLICCPHRGVDLDQMADAAVG
jgi:hypothetical protein